MLFDGISRVVFLGEPGAGVRSFVSAFLGKFASSLYVNKLFVSINAAGENAEELNDAQNIEASTDMADYVNRVIPLNKIYSRDTSGFRDNFEFQLKIESENCGRIKFVNMLGNISDNTTEISNYGMSLVVIILDGKKLSDGTQPDMSATLSALKTLADSQPAGHHFEVLIAVSKADLFGVENTVSEEFFRQRCQCCQEIVDFCRSKKANSSFAAFSAANKETAKVFDANGNMVSDPDFEPWNIDTVGLSIISNAIPITRAHYLCEMETHLANLAQNKGIYNSESFKSTVEAVYSRKQLMLLLRCKYQFDRYTAHSREIFKYIKDRQFVINQL